MTQNIAVIDKTGRGHSICQALTRTNSAVTVHYIPGTIPGTAGIFDDRIILAPMVKFDDPESVDKYCQQHGIGFVVIMHIDALKVDLSTKLRSRGYIVFGPSSEAAQLETSKNFCKKICRLANISTPFSRYINNEEALHTHLSSNQTKSVMIKADWLTVNDNGAIRVLPSEPFSTVLHKLRVLQKQNQNAPFCFLVEDYLEGFDYSAHYFINKHSVIELPSAQDYKMSHYDDHGTNCDGMRSISPHPIESPELKVLIRTEILDPMLTTLKNCSIVFNGVMYLGLRVDEKGKPHLIEINVRMGDSESEVIFPRITENLLAVFTAIADGKNRQTPLQVNRLSGIVVSLVADSPNDIKGPSQCSWPNTINFCPQKIHFNPKKLKDGAHVHWGNVTFDTNGALLTGIGRVAHISAFARTLVEAQKNVYSSINAITFKGIRIRSDIGDTNHRQLQHIQPSSHTKSMENL